MNRGSTPTHYFDVAIDTSNIKEVKITYSQSDKIILEKYKKDCTIEEGRITTTLTQEETFLFKHDKLVLIQIRVLTSDGKCIPSNIMVKDVGECLDTEVLK